MSYRALGAPLGRAPKSQNVILIVVINQGSVGTRLRIMMCHGLREQEKKKETHPIKKPVGWLDL